MSTKNDLLAAWVNRTGDLLPEARHRIRVLSEDGLLPQRAEPVTYEHLASALLGFVISDTHKDAADGVRAVAMLCPGAVWGDGDREFAGSPLLATVVAALQSPFSIASLTGKPASRTVELTVHKHHPLIDASGQRSTTDHYGFASAIPTRDGLHPLIVSRAVYFDLIAGLISDLQLKRDAGLPARKPASTSDQPLDVHSIAQPQQQDDKSRRDIRQRGSKPRP